MSNSSAGRVKGFHRHEYMTGGAASRMFDSRSEDMIVQLLGATGQYLDANGIRNEEAGVGPIWTHDAGCERNGKEDEKFSGGKLIDFLT